MRLLGWWGRFVYRRRWLVLVVSVLTLGVSVASLVAGGQLRNVPFRDTEAGRTNQLIRDEFPRPTGAPAAATSSFVLIFTSTAGLDAADKRFIGDMNDVLSIESTANAIAVKAIRTCGGQAMLKNLPLERIYRDSRCGSLMLPWTAEICLDRLGRESLYEPGEKDE